MIERFIREEGFTESSSGWKKGKFEIRKKNEKYLLDLKQRTIFSSANFDEIALRYIMLKRSKL